MYHVTGVFAFHRHGCPPTIYQDPSISAHVCQAKTSGASRVCRRDNTPRAENAGPSLGVISMPVLRVPPGMGEELQSHVQIKAGPLPLLRLFHTVPHLPELESFCQDESPQDAPNLLPSPCPADVFSASECCERLPPSL